MYTEEAAQDANSAIDAAFGRLDAVLGDLADVVDSFNKRLMPVMRDEHIGEEGDDGTVSGPADVRETHSQVHKRIDGAAERANRLQQILTGYRSRLEI